MTKTLFELLAMLKIAEKEINKKHNVLMVNKTVIHKKSGKKEKGKFGKPRKGDKTVVTTPKAPKPGPKPGVECLYCKGVATGSSIVPSTWRTRRPERFL
jgi:hypothetical protein